MTIDFEVGYALNDKRIPVCTCLIFDDFCDVLGFFAEGDLLGCDACTEERDDV